MAQVITVKLSRGDTSSPWGFRLQGGKDFATPLAVSRVNPSSLADQAGLQSGDALIKVNGQNVDTLKHKEAQDVILRSGNALEIVVQRGGMTIWKPKVTPLSKPSAVQMNNNVNNHVSEPIPVTKTSLAANKQESRPIGNAHNVKAKPFALGNGSVTAVLHKQYNSPANLYSMDTIAETLSQHTEVLATGAKGINFMKEQKPINTESMVYRLVHEEDTTVKGADEEEAERFMGTVSPNTQSNAFRRLQQVLDNGAEESPRSTPMRRIESPVSTGSPMRHVEAPVTKPADSKAADQANQSICGDCGRLIVGVFVRVGNKSLHAECFRCATCGTSLKNVGYFNINDKLYCDIHARQVARVMAPSASLEPLTVSPGAMIPNDVPIVAAGVPPPPASAVSPPSVPRAAPLSPSVPRAAPQSPSLLSCVSPVPFHPVVGEPNLESEGERASSLPPASMDIKTEIPNVPFPNFPPVEAPKSSTSVPTYQQVHKPSPMFQSHPQTAPFNESHRPFPGTPVMPPGSRPAPKRGRGTLNPQAAPGTRIPVCAACSGPIRGPFIVALNKTWCPDHFLCAYSHCRRPLMDLGFVEEQGKLYCENCYEAYLAPVCSKCNNRIKGDCLNALDKQWHPECFICAYCHQPFGNNSFYLEDGLPYCEKDWNELFTTKCVGCGFPIEAGDRWVEALNNNYHSQCFKCTICHKNLEGQSFYAKGGRPFCKAHAR